MISTRTLGSTTWVDIENPKMEEIIHLSESHPIPQTVLHELTNLNIRSKVDLFEKERVIYLVLHFPSLSPATGEYVDQEIDILLSENTLITTHYEPMIAVYEFSKLFEVETLLNRHKNTPHAGFLFLTLIRLLYKETEDALNSLNTELMLAEAQVIKGNYHQNVSKISNINRKLIQFQQALRFHGGILNSFERSSENMFGSQLTSYISLVSSEYSKIESLLEGHKDILRDLRETNDSLLSSKTNSIITFLTVITFFTVPIAIIVDLLQIQQVQETLRLATGGDILGVVIGLSIVTIFVTIFIKSRKWF